MTGGFGPPNTPPASVKFDRPFLMAIEHYRTGALVFLGTVTRPSAYVAPVLSATRSCELVWLSCHHAMLHVSIRMLHGRETQHHPC